MFGKKKRPFKELQKLILRTLRTKKLTKRQIADKIKADWRTIDHQIILLKGQDYVSLLFQHHRMKVYEITKDGLRYLKKL